MGGSAMHPHKGSRPKKWSSEKAKGWALDKWVDFFHYLYGDVDKDVPPTILWLNAVDEATKLSEWVRRDKPDQALRRVVRLFGWTCSFAGKYLKQQKFDDGDPIKGLLRENKVGRDFNREFLDLPESYLKWVLWKYPTVCTVCGGRPCECGIQRALVEARKVNPVYAPQFARNQRKWAKRLKGKKETFGKKKFERYKNRPLDQLIDEFIYIYGGGHQDVELWSITAHLTEEVGEVARDILAIEELTEKKLIEMGDEDLRLALEASWRVYVSRKLEATTLSTPDWEKRVARVWEKRTFEPDDGLPSSFLDMLNNQIRSQPQKAAALLRECALEDLKGELADVFSWLSAFLHKIGEGRRAYRKEARWYNFADEFLLDPEDGYSDRAGNLCCPRCKQRKCSKGCLLSGIFHTILHEKGEMELREDLTRAGIKDEQS